MENIKLKKKLNINTNIKNIFFLFFCLLDKKTCQDVKTQLDSPIIFIISVELGQCHFLQLHLQFFILPLEVHNDRVQEVDLIHAGKDGTI